VPRRLGRHCSRVDVSKPSSAHDAHHILKAMGHEIAKLHPASERKRLLRDLDRRPAGCCLAAWAKAMADATEDA